MVGRPDIFQYADYRDFLRDYYAHTKESNPKFSYRRFSQKMGEGPHNLLFFVIAGKRNLTKKFVPLFSKAIGFNKKERQFFDALVSFNQAGDPEGKRYYLEVLHSLKKEKVGAILNSEQFACISVWYYAVILEMVSLANFRDDPAWIKKELGNKVMVVQIKDALDSLLKHGFLKRDDNGKLVRTEMTLSTTDGVAHTAAYAFHQQMLALSKETLSAVHSSRREISGITMAVSEKQFGELRTMVREFENTVLKYLENNTDNFSAVYQLNFQLFPLTGGTGEGEKA